MVSFLLLLLLRGESWGRGEERELEEGRERG